MPFGDKLSKLKRIELEDALGNKTTLEGNLAKIGLKIIGIPHIGLRNRAAKIFSMIKLNKNQTVLDAGAGYGLYSLTLSGKVKKVYSVEIDKKRVEHLKKLNKSNVIVKNNSLTKIELKNRVIDIIICTEVLEHIKDDNKAFNEMSRVLKKQGIFILTVPAINEITRKTYKDFEHFRPGYTIEELKKLCKENNLRIEKIDYGGSPLQEYLYWIHSKFIKSKVLTAITFYPLYLLSKFYFLNRNKSKFNTIYIKMIKN